MTDHAAVAEIMRGALLALEFCQARIAGLPHCTCGRYQWAGSRYIANELVGNGFRDEVEGEPLDEAICAISGCGDWCKPGGEIVPSPLFAGGATGPVETSREEECEVGVYGR